jgi:hypothetical protein
MILPDGQYEFWWLMSTGEFPCPKLKKYKSNYGYWIISGQFNHKEHRCPEHRIVMAEWLCRPLNRCEDIHHINYIKTDNRIENLMVCNRKEHFALHPFRARYKGWHHTPKTRAILVAHHKSKGGSWKLNDKTLSAVVVEALEARED